MNQPNESTFNLLQDENARSLGSANCLFLCGDCSHFLPYRDPQTGRIHPTKQGRCGWKPNIKWSMAYRRNGFGSREEDPIVSPGPVWKHTNAKTCGCFSPALV